MIRTKSQIYGERNNPNTVITAEGQTGSLVIGAGNKGVRRYIGPDVSTSSLAILIVKNGKVDVLMIDSPDLVVGTNGSGEIVAIERSAI